MENSSAGIPAELPEASLYEESKYRIEISTSGSNNNFDLTRVASTYMPRYLLIYIYFIG